MRCAGACVRAEHTVRRVNKCVWIWLNLAICLCHRFEYSTESRRVRKQQTRRWWEKTKFGKSYLNRRFRRIISSHEWNSWTDRRQRANDASLNSRKVWIRRDACSSTHNNSGEKYGKPKVCVRMHEFDLLDAKIMKSILRRWEYRWFHRSMFAYRINKQ